MIDNFTTGAQSLLNAFPGTSVNDGVAASAAIGGARNIAIQNGANVYSSTASVTPALGRFDFTSQVAPPSNGTQFTLKYDGSTASALNPVGLGGVNVTGLGCTGVLLVGNNTSIAPELVTIVFYTSATAASQGSVYIPSGASNAPVFLPFAAFTPVSGLSNANFGSLGALTVTVSYASGQGSSGSLALVGFAASVPEPSPLFLLGVAAGLAALHRGRSVLRGRSPQ